MAAEQSAPVWDMYGNVIPDLTPAQIGTGAGFSMNPQVFQSLWKNSNAADLLAVAETRELGYPVYQASAWVRNNQWLILGGALAVLGITVWATKR